jgi:hypothetical protein
MDKGRHSCCSATKHVRQLHGKDNTIHYPFHPESPVCGACCGLHSLVSVAHVEGRPHDEGRPKEVLVCLTFLWKPNYGRFEARQELIDEYVILAPKYCYSY